MKSFRTRGDFRAWLERHHDSKTELMMRLFKVHARHRGIGYREALDEALCFGWIDGVRRALDDDSFTQRFTPRKTKSNWSAVNVKRYRELESSGVVHAAGAAAFSRWDGKKAPYSFESAPRALAPELMQRFRAKTKAWAFWERQPSGYRRVMTHWVMSAKREDTRERRFAALLKESAAGRRVDFLTPPTRKG
ncbi:MAG TPA: YdeI/OmpD-associated family protein [Gemmatimonadaceae bacterium]|nr:YdeI/OmpD-associated family protein [Gemmatimonadaceae bacterium]